MLRIYFWTLVLLTCGMCPLLVQGDPTTNAPAASPPPGPIVQLHIDFGGELKRSDLLVVPEVADSLRLSVEQRKALSELNLPSPTPEKERDRTSSNRPKDESPEVQVMRELLNRRTEAEIKKEITRESTRLMETLDREQMQRLNELYLRYLDGQSLGDSVVSQFLELTPIQKVQVNQLREEGAHKFLGELHARITQSNAGADSALRKAYSDLAEPLGKRMLALLSPDQLKKFETLKGEPFTFSESARQMLLELTTSRYFEFVSQAAAVRPIAE